LIVNGIAHHHRQARHIDIRLGICQGGGAVI
jgi:hypothetical protein